jgi:hypothetical protein
VFWVEIRIEKFERYKLPHSWQISAEFIQAGSKTFLSDIHKLIIQSGKRINCHSTGRNLLLYLFITRLERCTLWCTLPEVFFMPNHVGHCCINVIWGHCWAALCSNSVLTSLLHYVILGNCCTTMHSNNDPNFYCHVTVSEDNSCANVVWCHCCMTTCSIDNLSSHCCATVFQQWDHCFNCCMTMTLLVWVAFLLGKCGRQIDR